MTFVCKPFQQLTLGELHDLLRLRSEVFVVEQRCIYLDVDGHDPHSWHLLAFAGSQLVGYARWYEEDEAIVLGRIALRADLRGGGRGRQLVAAALAEIGPREVRIQAQSYLEGFYRRLGFEPRSAPYDLDGIPHVRMVRPAGAE